MSEENLLTASSWRNKPNEQMAFVLEKHCPVQREEGKRVRERFLIHRRDFLGVAHSNPLITECCCQDVFKNKQMTPTCPYYNGIEKTISKKGKKETMVHCLAPTLASH